MNTFQKLLAAPLLAVGLAVNADAQVGKQLPDPELEDFANTKATSYEDFQGRLVLIEFFAYW